MSVVLTELQVVAVRSGKRLFFANNESDTDDGVLCLQFRRRRLASGLGNCPRFTRDHDEEAALPNVGDNVVCEVERGYRGRWFAVAWTTRQAWDAAAASTGDATAE